jgi:hypothetical protein
VDYKQFDKKSLNEKTEDFKENNFPNEIPMKKKKIFDIKEKTDENLE